MKTAFPRIAFTVLLAAILLCISGTGFAQQGASTDHSAPAFDVKAATDAYLAKVSADQRARSDAYFEGGYWLQLWDFLITIAIFGAMLHWGISARMRDLAARITRFRPLQTAIYSVQFILFVAVVQFPWAVYEGFFREHKYGLSNQTFGPWFRDEVVGLVVAVVLGSLFLIVLFGIMRRLGKNWWIWGAGATILFFAFIALIAPLYIFPLFHKFTKLQDPRVKDPILSMARANGVPANDVYEFDESRTSNRVSANVSGLGSTARISLNDNLLKRCSPGAVQAVMGHEMGHYVLNHQYKGLVMNGVVVGIGFAFLNWSMIAALKRWGEKWQVRDITDIAVLPLAAIVLTIYFFVLTPVDNTITRTMEYEADIFGLNASQQPDGEAEVDLMLGEYRKLDPSPLEEMIFFDHPSGRTRITAAMRWKAEHMPPVQPAAVADEKP